ncbi:hypothetical protein PSN45_000021 [Yamadazyma tenuis]|uniref:Kinase-like protein n=1 Tax=Candida tenuis (strain ATCC 10573 / BCRC 21748 / CBS 615 / JCM 9827 / NBRC 10315 / NRRL Y-1498 / VKM Y-70) TaxID=590646 RepID=G3B9Y8_CANTC|nr:kinase-like protein [Yamadazyma tenuis ATCC 10573]XP_006688664.1 uncharacterized protein CANTEDRAFT_114821 [Yamadazyma tenuis ATCC 10573]EGV62493.1 kinase-like protein [Yamadazyma tenuis ATCC 10573]EGV62494.1 hypothetical protein CANTEDRAFT_114821 [Yamadazyma tenuis ATCC 10573]WEJ92571.1 hypothetical protein PSN45_000021 [Yamadazyma tenuis]
MNKDIEKTVTEIRGKFDTSKLSDFITNENAISSNPSVSLGIHIPKWQGPLTIKQFVFGQSNPTYLIIDANNNLSVLRRKPFPNSKLVSKSAHAIEREFFIINGINTLNERSSKKVPVPDTYFLCEDESIIGYVFYVMEYVEGASIKNPDMGDLAPAKKDQLWNSIMDTITAIHSLDADKLIESLPEKHFPQFKKPKSVTGSSASYFERQMKTLAGVSKKQGETVEPIPHFDVITQYILKNAPKDPVKKMLIHGDCKIDNFLFDKQLNKVIAVLDWELCTFGHPLFDLANFLQPFQIPNELNALFFAPLETDVGKENSASLQLIQDKLKLYKQKLGFVWDPNDPSNDPVKKWQVGFLFGLVRLSVISQGIAMRIKKGSASSANAAGFGSLYPYLAELVFGDIRPPKL